MSRSFHRRLALPLFVTLLAAACGSGGSSSASRPTTTTTEPVAVLPASALRAYVDALPASLGVPGVIVGVSQDGHVPWVGAAGIDDVATSTAMPSEGRFRAASITKLFTATVVMGLVERRELDLSDRLSAWFPDFPNADTITVQMLLTHTAGVTADWWDQPEILDLTLADLARTWTPTEVLDVMAQRPPAGPPGGASIYSNTGFILLGEIAAQVAGAPIGELIEDRVIDPLGLQNTSYAYDPGPGLVHGYIDFQGSTLDTLTTTPGQAFASMAGAAGAIQTDAADLLVFVDALLSGELVEPTTVTSMQQTDLTGIRWGLAMMGYCPCLGSGPETTYAGWGHSGEIPGAYSVVVHFPDESLSVVVFMNTDTVNGSRVDHAFLDPIVDDIRALVTER